MSSTVKLAMWAGAMFLLAFLVRSSWDIRVELKRANDIECVRIQNEGLDSFGPLDRSACPPEGDR